MNEQILITKQKSLKKEDSSLHQIATVSLTPLMSQYKEVKGQYPESLLFFRLGDFYELFEDDAVIAARILDITLTGRPEASYPNGRVPMAGVPVRSVELYLAKLLAKGHSVAVCEQVGVVGLEKGPVERRVTRVLTPGTVLESHLLPKRASNYLACIVSKGKADKENNKTWGLAYVEASCAEFFVSELNEDELLLELGRLSPAEILVAKRFAKLNASDEIASEILDAPDSIKESYRLSGRADNLFQHESCRRRIKQFFGVATLEGFGCENMPLAVQAAGVILEYLERTQGKQIPHFKGISTYYTNDQLVLDNNTRKNLELTETMRDRSFEGSLLWRIDETKTAMGSRLLRKWLLKPLLNVPEIQIRQETIAELIAMPQIRNCLEQTLTNLADLERLAVKLKSATGSPRDLLAISESILKLPELAKALGGCKSSFLAALAEVPSSLLRLADLISQAIDEEAPREISEGNIFRSGFNTQLDEIRSLLGGGKDWINKFQQEEITGSGIRNLKVSFNRTFGYFIEITNSNRESVPEHYIRKQTLTNAERYITPELKEYEAKILNAEKHQSEFEYKLFFDLRIECAQYAQALYDLAQHLAALDALFSLTQVALSKQYIRPLVDHSLSLSIKAGRHPVLEQILPAGQYVSNDVCLEGNSDNKQMIILTGPNMSGKSSYLRQVAEIVILAQMGSFVSADEAHIGLVDRIFTRIGAVDDLTQGQSTFMVEMTEVTQCCLSATERSLILFDEVGRGTSTYDGVAIAWSVAEYLAKEIRARTIFATHYHELNALTKFFPQIKNFQVLVKEQDGHVHFIRTVIPGGASRSFGIQVAKMSGLPTSIVIRAENLMKDMERKSAAAKIVDGPKVNIVSFDDMQQLSLFESG
jgi:DNA mismatch repair protein MutS